MSSKARQSLALLLRQLQLAQLAGPQVQLSGNYRRLLSTTTAVRISGKGDDGGWKVSNTKGSFYRSKPRQDIGESTIFVQEGINIQEVPVAVLKTNEINTSDSTEVHDEKGYLFIGLVVPVELVVNNRKRNFTCFTDRILPYLELDPREEEAFIEGFKKYHSPKEILKILDTIPSQEVTPAVAICVVRKLFELENNFSFRNNGKSWLISTSGEKGSNNLESFGRMAVVSRLIDTIISSNKNQVLLDGLDVLGLEANNSSALRYYFETNEEFLNYRMKLCNEVLVRVVEGKLQLEDICRAICSIGQIGKSNGREESIRVKNEMQTKFLDKMWPGILEKSNEINSNNISQVFNAVRYLNKSRRLVMDLVERKIFHIWWNLKLSQIADICEIVATGRKITKESVQDPWNISNRVLMAFSRNLSLNLHKVTEDELICIIKAFHVLGFCDSTTEKSLSRYMKAKCLKVRDPKLVTTILEYVSKFRLRSSHILEAASEYAITNKDLTPVQLTAILVPFGYLDFQPIQPVKFWQSIEKRLIEKFIQFTPKDIIEVLLSCVYLQKYPLNFVSQIFSPYFLDRLHTSESDFRILQLTRSRLKLLDSALTLECGLKYSGPLLPKDFSAKSHTVDGRIYRMAPFVESVFTKLFTKSTCFTEICVKLPNMPFNELYFVDIFINLVPSSAASAEQQVDPLEQVNLRSPTDILRQRFNPRSPGSLVSAAKGSDEQQRPFSKELLAVLIHIPEHFCSDGNNLVGSQVMRIRHLKLLGLTVVSLKFEALIELRHQTQALHEYLQDRLTHAKVVTTF